MPQPTQFTTAVDGSLVGLVDGVNRTYLFTPLPGVFTHTASPGLGMLVFRSGQLLDELQDFSSGPGWFNITNWTPGDTITVLFFDVAPPGKFRLSQNGLTVVGGQMYFTPNLVVDSLPTALMLFRSGQLLTKAADYLQTGPWITLMPQQAIQPEDGWYAMLGPGTVCTTNDGSITGTINGINNDFHLPRVPAGLMLFRNGQFLAPGQDYILTGTTVTLQGAQVPIVGDILTGWLLAVAPRQISTADGSLSSVTALQGFLYRNGMFMKPPSAGAVAGNTTTLAPIETPLAGDIVTVEVWTPNITDSTLPPLNLPVQMEMVGAVDGQNNVFTLPTDQLVTQVQIVRNGLMLASGPDYNWTTAQPSSAGGWVTTIAYVGIQTPQPGDAMTVEVYLS